MPRAYFLEVATLAASAGDVGDLNALEDVQVDVFSRGTVTPVQIFTTETLGTVESNPIITGPDGLVAFWANPGKYDIRFTDTLGSPRFTPFTIGWDSVPYDSFTDLSPTGSIVATVRRSLPSGWLLCDGSAVSRVTYANLWDALRTDEVGTLTASSPFGNGDGSTTFNLPDLRGRVLISEDALAGRIGTNDVIGNSGGAETHTLTVGEIPAHDHDIYVSDGTSATHGHTSGSTTAAGAATNATVSALSTSAIQPIGGGGAHANLQPYLTANYMIRF